MCDDGLMIDLSSAILMHKDTQVKWNPIPELVQHVDACCQDVANVNSMRRATEFVRRLCALDDPISCDDVILTLDGDTSNVRAMEVELKKLLPARAIPSIVTVEMDADVALAQYIIRGNNVIFSGTDPSVKVRRLVGAKGVPKIEHLIQLACILTPSKVIGAYFDYCSGPPAHMTPDVCYPNMRDNVLARLPRLRVYGATLCKRWHSDLKNNFGNYVPTAHGFECSDTFLDNARVVCKMYTRTRAPRHLAIPGLWWKNCPRDLRRKIFEGVVVEKCADDSEKYKVFVAEENAKECFVMREDALRAYAVQKGGFYNKSVPTRGQKKAATRKTIVKAKHGRCNAF